MFPREIKILFNSEKEEIIMNKCTMQFSFEQGNTLDKYAKEMETTRENVLRKALSLLTVALEEKKKGNRVSVTKDGEIVKEIVGY